MNKRWIDIVKYLGAHNVATSEAMAEVLCVSAKTIRTDLKGLGEELKENGAHIQSKQRVGYSLVIDHQEIFTKFLTEIYQDTFHQPATSEERISYLLELLLIHSDDYVKLDDLANQLYVSKSSISVDLKEVRKILDEYNLKLTTRPNYGIKVEGKEFDFRLCTTSYTIKKLDKNLDYDIDQKIRRINECVSGHLKNSSINISDVSYHNLLIHIYIAIKRIKEEHYVPMDIDMLLTMKQKEAFVLSTKIVESLEEIFDIVIPESEIGYLAIHLSGKQFIEYTGGDKNFVVSAEISSIVKHMLNEIKSSYHIDFTDDFDLTMNLALHLVPMEIRIQYDMNLRNPLLSDIKQRYSLAYMLAVSACGVLKKHYQKDVGDEEIGYFALHFNLALERMKTNVDKKNIVIVCATGKGSASILVHKIKMEVGKYLNNIVTCDVMRLENFDFSTIDYVVTTVPIPYKIPKPILEIQFFMDEKDIKAVKSLLRGERSFALQKYFDERLFINHMKATRKDEVIRKMVHKITEVKDIPEEFYHLVMEREQMAVTAFGNLVAIPHPCRAIGIETFVCIAILDEPILWDSVEVQFVFMMSLKEERDENMELFSTMISRFLINTSYIQLMLKTRDYQTLADCFNDIEKEMRNE